MTAKLWVARGEQAARVGGAEGALEVHGGAEGFGVPGFVEEVAGEDALEQLEVAGCGWFSRVLGVRRSFFRGELEGGGSGLAELLRGQAEELAAGGRRR